MDISLIEKKIKEKEEEIIAVLKKMIQLESKSGQEEEMAQFLADEMRRRNYDQVEFDSVGSVLGRVGQGDNVMLFDAHLDTVVAGEEAEWKHPPYEGKRVEGNIWGRGSCDDKGPLAAFLLTGELIKELGLYEDWTFYFSGTVMEEVCEGITLGHLLEEKEINPDYVVIGEASELKICRGHRGRILLEANFAGQALHASDHNDKDHAIYKALPFISAVPNLDKKLPEDPDLGQGDICVTKVECQSNSLNSTPANCKVILDRRTTTKDSKESVLQELAELPGAEEAQTKIRDFQGQSYRGVDIEAEEFYPAWIMAEDNKLIQAGIKAYENATNKEAEVDVWGFSTNGNYSQGKEGIPTIGFGPGEMELCHALNERLNLEQFWPAVKFYTMLPNYL